MTTTRHHQLMRELDAIVQKSWSEEALSFCLSRLIVGSLTEGKYVDVIDAWVGPGDQISVVYIAPWGSETIGLRRHRETPARTTYPDSVSIDGVSARVFGESVADWDIGEPIGPSDDRWWHDSQGVAWWGDFGTFEPSA